MNPAFADVKGYVYPTKDGNFAFWIQIKFYCGDIVNYKEVGGYPDRETAKRDCDRAIEIKKAELEVILIKNNQTAGITTAQIH